MILCYTRSMAPPHKLKLSKVTADDSNPKVVSEDRIPTVAPGQPFMVVVTVEKLYARSPGDGARVQLLAIAEEGLRKLPGWDSEIPSPKTKQEYKTGAFEIVCTGKIILRHSVGQSDSLRQITLRAEKVIGEIGKATEAKGRGWRVADATGPGGFKFDLERCRNARLLQGKIESAFIHLPDDWHPYFDPDIYGLDHQIRLIWDALSAFIESDYQQRSHVCCYGQPGCGKSTVVRRFVSMLEELSPKGAIKRFTASQTTKAGLELILLEANPKPTLIAVEEIDKTSPDNVSCFLDVFDTEGTIRRTNARDGQKENPIQALGMCTANNLPKFRGFHDGALASRFSQKIFFPRPNKEVLRLIALREIRKTNGNEKWADKALAQLEAEGTNDPRRLRAILTSRKRLMDGSAVKDMAAMAESLRRESEELIAADEKRQRLHAKLDLSDG